MNVINISVISKGELEINEIYGIGLEDEAKDRFKDLIREKWIHLISANTVPPVDDQCWKDILDTGRFQIRDTNLYMTEEIVKR